MNPIQLLNGIMQVFGISALASVGCFSTCGVLKIFDLHRTDTTTTLPLTNLVSVEALESNTSG